AGRRALADAGPHPASRQPVPRAPGHAGEHAQDPARPGRGLEPQREQGRLRRGRPRALLLEVPDPLRPRRHRRRALQTSGLLRLSQGGARRVPSFAAVAARAQREARAAAVPRERDRHRRRRDDGADDRRRHRGRSAGRRGAPGRAQPPRAVTAGALKGQAGGMLTTCSKAVLRFTLVTLTAVLTVTLPPSTVLAQPSSNPAVDQVRQPTATPSAESEYDRGVRARLSKDWKVAVEAQRSALALRPAFPEAWNELGFALRNQGRYPESLQAYDE